MIDIKQQNVKSKSDPASVDPASVNHCCGYLDPTIDSLATNEEDSMRDSVQNWLGVYFGWSIMCGKIGINEYDVEKWIKSYLTGKSSIGSYFLFNNEE